MFKPIIAINADYRTTDDNESAFSFVSADYYDAILQVGGLPMILPPLEKEEDIEAFLDRIDGLLLVGGADLDPRRDGWMLHPAVRLLHQRREIFDRKLVRLASDRQIPIFGIGVGMQLLNVAHGGNLFLHIPEDKPNALPHRDFMDPAHRHGLVIEPHSLMEEVYGDGELRVNSMHHMAVDEVAPGFRVTARCPDGVIEAIESMSPDWFALGTQFHPEKSTASALDVRMFEEFVLAARQAKKDVRLVA
ncbi:MAG: gamma-glutamyl-gamma-aminobutyrate hydrolase family protein [Pirellulales bacterium]|nr:gamma-glutamyl-gamma-aminobutyrate hydrolase family protein [Pirellulales bacterium]